MLVVALAGSPSLKSRSGVLLEHAQKWLEHHGIEVRTFKVRDFAPEDLLHARFDSPAVQQMIATVQQASGLLVATPVYKASLSGALKTMLDLLPERALDDKIALPLATGGSVAHMLAVDYSLKPVLSALKAQEVIHSVFAEDRQIAYGDDADRLSDELRERLNESMETFLHRLLHSAQRAPQRAIA